MNIFAIALNIHDHNWYNGKTHYLAERYTRWKHNLNLNNPQDPTPSREFFIEHFLANYKKQTSNNIFAFTCSNLGQQFVIDLIEEHIGDKSFLDFKPKNLWDFYQTDNYYYIDHHQSHAVYALLSSGFSKSDVLAIDGRGWQFNCIFVDTEGNITDLSDKVSIGGLWNRLSQDLGFGYLGAGKTMGLAGFGKYNQDVHRIIDDYLENPNHKLPKDAHKVLENILKEDVAFTLQEYTVNLIKEHVYPLKTSDNLCIAGGVAYNGYMNEEFTKYYKKVYVPPAAGDEGQAIGAYMHADFILNDTISSPSVYAGQEHEFDGAALDEYHYRVLDDDELYAAVARAIAEGKIIGWYQGRSESGNRALGNRSILADPRNPDIKNIINSRIKLREDFRPFAPSVLEEHYGEYFDTNQPSPYMSRIVPVISDQIPGVTHVDGTARIQTVARNFNPRYYDLIAEFYKQTGIPMLLNTSFNCQEPIVETPIDAIATFHRCDLDVLVIGNYMVTK